MAQAIKRSKTTAGQVNLTLEVCRDLYIPLPPLPEQEAIAEAAENQLSVIDHLEAGLDLKLESTQALRQSILHHAFTGQLVPQDPNDEPASKLLERIAAEREARARETAAAKHSGAGLLACLPSRRQQAGKSHKTNADREVRATKKRRRKES